MVNKNMLRRNYIIIRRIMRNDSPSKAKILQYLKNNDIDVNARTLERDINAIRYNLGVEIKYDNDKNGYFIDTESSDDFDKLLYFIGLAENADNRMENTCGLISSTSFYKCPKYDCNTIILKVKLC